MELDGSELPDGEVKARSVQRMFDDIAPRYDRVNRVISLRLDIRWRRRTVRDLALPAGSTVVDLATGTGDFCEELSDAGHRPVGMDFSFGMLAHAHTSEPLAQADSLRLPLADASVDGVTCGFALRNYTDLAAFLAECARVTRSGGRVALLDAAEPTNPLLKAGHAVWFKGIVPRLGALLSKGSAYRYLPKSLAYLPPGPELTEMLRSAGFPDASRRTFLGGSAQLLVGTRSA